MKISSEKAQININRASVNEGLPRICTGLRRPATAPRSQDGPLLGKERPVERRSARGTSTGRGFGFCHRVDSSSKPMKRLQLCLTKASVTEVWHGPDTISRPSCHVVRGRVTSCGISDGNGAACLASSRNLDKAAAAFEPS